jgi:hypothetical protein
MAGKNEVTITFASEGERDVEGAFDRVGKSARDMDDDVRASADGFDRAGEAADLVDTRAMGFRDTLTGLQDGFAGIKAVNKSGLGLESLLLLGFGIGDLASGFFNFLIPSLKSAVTWLKAGKLAALASAAAGKVAAIGSKIWAAAQWLLNVALSANPIGLIIIAIIAFIAIIIIAWKRSETFRKIVTGAWNGIKVAALAVGRWFTGTLWPWIHGVIERLAAAFYGLPGRIRSAFSGLISIITWPWRTAFNLIARAWNSTVGRLSFSIPSWVPGIGGNSFSAPRLPTFHRGGIVPGAPGQEMLAVLQAGERVTPAGASGGAVSLVVSGGGGSTADRMLSELVLHLIRTGKLRLTVRDNRVAVA